MNVNELVKRILGRRIALAIIAVAVCAAGAYGYTTGVTIRQSTASAVVIPPPTFSVTGDTIGANPVLNLSPEKAQLAGVVTTAMYTEAAQQAVQAKAPGVTYKVSNLMDLGPNNMQPSAQITITVMGGATADTQAAAATLLDVARDALVKLQVESSVAPENWANLTTVLQPTAPFVVSSSATKSAGSLAVAAMLAGAVAMLLYDAYASRRDRRRGIADQETPAAAVAQPVAVTRPAVTKPAATAPAPAAAPAPAPVPVTTEHTVDVADPDDADEDGIEIDDEELAQAVLNWTPPRLTDFRSWRSSNDDDSADNKK